MPAKQRQKTKLLPWLAASVLALSGASTLQASDIDWNGYWAIEAFNFMIEVDAKHV